jgi:hypothetical protein
VQALLKGEENIAAEVGVTDGVFYLDGVVIGGIGDENEDVSDLVDDVVEIRFQKIDE